MAHGGGTGHHTDGLGDSVESLVIMDMLDSDERPGKPSGNTGCGCGCGCLSVIFLTLLLIFVASCMSRSSQGDGATAQTQSEEVVASTTEDAGANDKTTEALEAARLAAADAAYQDPEAFRTLSFDSVELARMKANITGQYAQDVRDYAYDDLMASYIEAFQAFSETSTAYLCGEGTEQAIVDALTRAAWARREMVVAQTAASM